MNDCFRFLINTDQCIKMSSFDMFFYRKLSQHKIHINEVQLYGNDFASSLRSATGEIRSYLNKYPYIVGDYHIIVTMRANFGEEKTDWNKSILYRLIQIDHEIASARIYLNSTDHRKKSLSMVVLYDTDVRAETTDIKKYFSGSRVKADSLLLIRELGIDENCTFDELTKALEDYRHTENYNEATDLLLREFFADYRESTAYLLKEEMGGIDNDVSVLDALADFINKKMNTYQVFETIIDKNDQRSSILTLLRIIDFINMTVDTDDPANMSTLINRNWDAAFEDRGTEKRYANMLSAYQKRLKQARTDLDNYKLEYFAAEPLPKVEYPSENEIKYKDNNGSIEDDPTEINDFKQALESFKSNCSGDDAVKKWEGVYQNFKQRLSDLDRRLEQYAQRLSSDYSKEIDKRNKLFKPLFLLHHTADEHTQSELDELKLERENIYRKLKSPKMNPSLRFQDQLDMERSLEEENQNIRYYLKCKNSGRFINFLMLVIFVFVLIVLHYSVLQPYVFVNVNMAFQFMIYAGVLFILMLGTWNVPSSFFRKKIQDSVKRLEENADNYIKAYAEKKENFRVYINLLNRLDYVARSYRLRDFALEETVSFTKGCHWHMIKIEDHLKKLKYFDGLISVSDMDLFDYSQYNIQVIDNNRVVDLIDCLIYQPEE